MHAIFSPADNSTSVIYAGGETVVAPGKWIEWRHHIVLPNEPEASETRLTAEKTGTTPRLSVRFRRVRLRDSGDEAAIVFHRPGDVAVLVRPAERPEIMN
jgi:hypothetical protein